MATSVPKQYLSLAGHQVIDWALQPFIEDNACCGVMVAIAADDSRWQHSRWAQHAKVHVVNGGADRASSVLAGLEAWTQRGVSPQSWILVHDAARPCLSKHDLAKLLAVAHHESVGALLATAVAETIKRAAPTALPRVLETVPRESLWRAQTPQMFKLGMLTQALQAAMAQGRSVTDESSAMEALGWQPMLVAGRADNIKITQPEDLLLSERILAATLNAVP